MPVKLNALALCEINVSSVYPFPEQAPAEVARLARDRVAAKAALRSQGIGGKQYKLS
jgi:hypothetical protein